MQENLVIVESPAKAKTIEKFLGKDYKVMSSYGHIRDLKKKEISIDATTLEPTYEIPEEKKKLVNELKANAAKERLSLGTFVRFLAWTKQRLTASFSTKLRSQQSWMPSNIRVIWT